MKAGGATILVASVLALSCAGAPAPKTDAAAVATPCAGITPPRRLTTHPVALPSSFLAAGVGGTVVVEAVVGADGAVSDVRLARTGLDLLAPFGEKSVQDSRFAAGSVDGHPAAMRVRVATPLGTQGKARSAPEYDSIWARIPGGPSREAAWQLAGSVEKLALEVHLGTSPAGGAEVVARAADGREQVLRKVPGSPQPVDVRETVSTGKFLETAGVYRIELRASGKTLIATTFTVADDYTRAVVNTCEPL